MSRHAVLPQEATMKAIESAGFRSKSNIVTNLDYANFSRILRWRGNGNPLRCFHRIVCEIHTVDTSNSIVVAVTVDTVTLPFDCNCHHPIRRLRAARKGSVGRPLVN